MSVAEHLASEEGAQAYRVSDAPTTADFAPEGWAAQTGCDESDAADRGLEPARRGPVISPEAPRRQRLAWWAGRREWVGGVGLAILIALATALTSHLIGTGRGVPHTIIRAWRLGPRGQLAVELAYYIAAGVTAAAALGVFALLRNSVARARRVSHRLGTAVAVAVVLGCFIGPDFALGNPPVGTYTSHGAYQFVSAPTLHPPIVRADVTQPGRLASGDIFLTNLYDPNSPGTLVGQSGPLILDQRLAPVWFRPVPENDLAANLSVQMYEGQPVLVWWQGQLDVNGTQSGEYVVLDQHYRHVATLRGADGWALSLHEIVIRGHDAWVTASKKVPVNLSAYGGARNGEVIDSAIQEYNLKTGQLLWSWDALTHVPLSDSWAPMPATAPWDAYHANSIDLVGASAFVVSMRNTSAAYKVDIHSGTIEWTLGGKHSSFSFGPGAEFRWQHDVMVYPGTPFVTVYDDDCCQATRVGSLERPTGPSRGLVLKLDPATRRVTLAAQYIRGARFDSDWMGNMQPLPGGNELIGWGSQPYFSEFNASGRLLFDAFLPDPDMSYRAIIEPWVGLPLYPPSGAARRRHGQTIVYASWNGATQVASWRVLGGSTSTTPLPATTAPKVGFETSIAVRASYRRFRVQALDGRGRVLGTSAPFGVTS